MGDYGLLFFYCEDFDEADVDAMEEFVADLAANSEWVGDRPEFVDHIQDEVVSEEDEPIRTVGGFLPLPPPEENPDVATELAHHAEVSRIVDALAAFSAKTGREIELEIGETGVGVIEHGEVCDGIRTGFLDPWRDALRE